MPESLPQKPPKSLKKLLSLANKSVQGRIAYYAAESQVVFSCEKTFHVLLGLLEVPPDGFSVI